ncbi:MAG: HigA family addiction module antitoxin [Alkalilacustris sp.]
MSLLTDPSHPGEVLSELYMLPLGMKAPTLARHLGVPRTRIERLVKGETALSADSAMRLAAFFQTTPEYWMNLQRGWDLARARETVDLSGIKPLQAA